MRPADRGEGALAARSRRRRRRVTARGYDCLIDAREMYRKLPAAAKAWVFETDLLIALREKELGLAASDALTEARRIAKELPRELEAGRYIELVEAIPAASWGRCRAEDRSCRRPTHWSRPR